MGPMSARSSLPKTALAVTVSMGGGADKAPSIATMPSVVALSDADLIKVVQDGTPAGMPSFSQLGDANIRAVVDFLARFRARHPLAPQPR